MYGLSFAELWDGMPLKTVEIYLDAMPRVLAQRRIEMAQTASLIWADHPDRLMKEWMHIAYGDDQPKVAATPGILKLMGIGVSYER